MLKRSSKTKKKQPSDINLLAAQIVEADAGPTEIDQPNKTPPEKNPAAVALGRLGGLKGGKARAEKLTTKQRKAIAKKAASVRWGKS